MHDKTIEHGYYTFEIKWKDDEEGADLSYLGAPTDKRGSYVVDRLTGQLLGEYAEATFTVKWEDVPGADMNEKGWILSTTWNDVQAMAEKYFAEQRITYSVPEIGDAADVHFDEDKREFWAEVSGYRILADNLGRTMGWGEYRYFDVEGNHLPHNPESWRNISLESMKGESFEAADIRYAVEDWKRWEAYNHNYWSMMGCIATVYKDGIEIAESSCWGIESDGGKEYIAEMEESVLDDALAQAELAYSAKELLEGNYA